MQRRRRNEAQDPGRERVSYQSRAPDHGRWLTTDNWHRLPGRARMGAPQGRPRDLGRRGG